MFSVNYRYQSSLGEIKYSEAPPRSKFLGKTKGLALKYVCAGTENYLINKEPIAVSAGQFILLRKDQVFQAETKVANQYTSGVCIDLKESHWESLMENKENQLLFHVPLSCYHLSGISHSCKMIGAQESFFNFKRNGSLFLENIKTELNSLSAEIVSIGFNLQRTIKKTSTQKHLLSKLMIAKDFIHQNFCSTIRLDHLAKHAGLSKFHLNRLFKKCFQQSPYEMQCMLRMKAAKVMIEQDQNSLAEIAFQLGYCNIAAFSNQFKQYYSCSPSSIRQRIN